MLPSLPALRAFDAAARRGSFRAAAEELSVSPTAISHHIRTLEEQLDLMLFTRIGRSVELTEDGKALAEATGQAFGLLSETVEALRGTTRPVVRIAAGPILAARWLMPRISEFWQLFPDISLEVVPTHHSLKQSFGDSDIAIRWDRLDDAPPEARLLLELKPVAVASPEFIDQNGPFTAPKDLLAVQRLHQRDLWGWSDWFRRMEVNPDGPLRGPVFEDANVVLRGAIEGQGVILGWLPLVEQELRDDRIRRLFDEDIAPTHGYFLTRRPDRKPNKAVRTVTDWLMGLE